ncbi:hypothetical protein ACIGDI_39965 [Streptomyces sp. NPDC085900]|uniref:hypothetical protein n=1 Tax=Streptomyces sp. NPDC085900 TaxID=3365737 RepID=UPI0037D136C8
MLLRKPVDIRRHHPARPAPRRPEEHGHGFLALEDDLLEIRVGHITQISTESPFTAGADDGRVVACAGA